MALSRKDRETMISNSAKWHSAGASERKRLEAENKRIGSSAGLKYNNGSWYDSSGGNALSPETNHNYGYKDSESSRPDVSRAGRNKYSGGGGSFYSGSSSSFVPSSVKTYNGTSFNLGDDYMSFMNNAYNSGDIAGAADYERKRNAKIGYLNSISGNPNKYEVTNKYQNFNSINELPDNWNSAVVGGNAYTKKDGGIYNDKNVLMGNGYNSATNEWTFNNDDDVRKAAAGYLADKTGLSRYGLDPTDYYLESGALDADYLNAVKSGTVSTYNRQLAEDKKEWLRQQAMLQKREDELRKQREEIESMTLQRMQPLSQTYNNDSSALNGNITSAQQKALEAKKLYEEMITNQMLNNRVKLY